MRTIYDIARVCNRMEEGQALTLAGSVIRTFPVNPWTGEPPLERLKSNLMGYAWGGFEIREDLLEDRITIIRRQEGNKLLHHDWDRRHLPLGGSP